MSQKPKKPGPRGGRKMGDYGPNTRSLAMAKKLAEEPDDDAPSFVPEVDAAEDDMSWMLEPLDRPVRSMMTDKLRDDMRLNRNALKLKVGKPRIVPQRDGQKVLVKLTSMGNVHAEQRGKGRQDTAAAAALMIGLEFPKELAGPSTDAAIDVFAATLHAISPNFGPATQAVRQSAQLTLSRGAAWFGFRPLLIAGPPGNGKTTWASELGRLSGLPTVHLDGSTMITTSSLVSSDAVFTTARASDIVTALANSDHANLIVVVDEVDKIIDVTKNGRENASEALLSLLDPLRAHAHRDPYLQADIDLSFINWVLLCNDLDRVSKPVLDRCKVIRLPGPSPADLEAIATAEIARRHLEPELVSALVRACRQGRIKSLRKLHKALDAAAATRLRPRLN